jgi:signal peptidase I
MKLRRIVRAAAVLAGAASALRLAVRRVRLEPMLVEGDSMRPTLAPGQRIVVAPLTGPPPRGALVVLRRPGPQVEGGPLEVVKRVAALPGDRVRLAGTEITLAADEYLVLGDNPARSTDGRSFGPVHSEDFVGIVQFAYWPPHRLARRG